MPWIGLSWQLKSYLLCSKWLRFYIHCQNAQACAHTCIDIPFFVLHKFPKYFWGGGFQTVHLTFEPFSLNWGNCILRANFKGAFRNGSSMNNDWIWEWFWIRLHSAPCCNIHPFNALASNLCSGALVISPRTLLSNWVTVIPTTVKLTSRISDLCNVWANLYSILTLEWI